MTQRDIDKQKIRLEWNKMSGDEIGKTILKFFKEHEPSVPKESVPKKNTFLPATDVNDLLTIFDGNIL